MGTAIPGAVPEFLSLMSVFARDTLVVVEPFTSQMEGDEVIIGRIETGVFLAIPEEAVKLLEHLAHGETVGQVSDRYQQEHGETPDLNEFLSYMESKGLVRPKVTDESSGGAARPIVSGLPSRHYHFSNFPQQLAQALVGWPARMYSLILIAAAGLVVILNPTLAPRPRDFYFPDHRTLCVTLLALASYATIFLHEFAHLVATRSLGINSRMGLSHRLWYLVAETDLTGLWSVPKQQRYLPLLAGVWMDLISTSFLVLLLWSNARQVLILPVLVLRLVRAFAFSYLLRVIWQLFFYMRTDFYYIVANFFNCKNLLKDTESFLKNQLARIIPSISLRDQSSIPTSERRVIRAYAFIWLAGRLFSFFVLFSVTIPVGMRYVKNISEALNAGYSNNHNNFFDALLLSAYFLAPLTAGFSMWITSLLRRERTQS